MRRNKKLRIGILFSPVNPTAGGSFTFVDQILRAILEHSKNSNDEFVFISNDFNDLSDISAGIETVKLHNFRVARVLALGAAVKAVIKFLLRKGVIDFAAIRGYAINRKLHKSNIDIVWSLEPMSFPLAIPYVTTLWDIQHRITPFFPEVSSEDDQWIKRERSVSRVLRQASLILVGTQRGSEEIRNAYGLEPQRILVSPFPAPKNNLVKMPKRDPFLFIYPAQFWPHKNHITLVRAFKLARERTGLDLRLVLSGSDKGTKKNVTISVQELELTHCVDFVGFISKEELLDLYSSARMLLFPTFFGPDNLPPLEAMSFHCPIAVSEIPGAKEQLGDAALYFDPNSAEELAQIIVNASQDSEGSRDFVEKGLLLCGQRTPQEYVQNTVARIQSFETALSNRIII
jgi:glycosyltransferase involved in cell wall biosynthesis